MISEDRYYTFRVLSSRSVLIKHSSREVHKKSVFFILSNVLSIHLIEEIVYTSQCSRTND